MTTKKQLKETVTSFLNTEFVNEGDYSSLPKTMFESCYPKAGSKWNGDFENEVLNKASALNLQVDFVDSYGGEEQGKDYWAVYSFTDGQEVVYVQFDGWYASYNGSEYEEWFFVEPKQVTVTQFFKI